MTAAPVQNHIESDCLERLAQGDDHAFAELVKLYSTPVYRFLFRMLGSQQDAEDLTQDVFYEIHRNRAKIRRDVGPLPYLFTIARRKAISKFRWRTVRKVLNPLSPQGEQMIAGTEATPRDNACAKGIDQAVQRALGGLKPDKRAVIILRYFEERTYKDIADIMNKPEGTVKTLAFRAERELRDRLNAHDIQDWLGGAV
ncbi:MAG: RNA polymerase sigma factor [Candidatus Hinthialibacter antarcticus]|nr:RNA polymerase sigma factor [Candidatus Hinthialibacter antarcticus]